MNVQRIEKLFFLANIEKEIDQQYLLRLHRMIFVLLTKYNIQYIEKKKKPFYLKENKVRKMRKYF